MLGSISIASDFKPGDPPPQGYNDWHEWARVQHKAGLRQITCGLCSKWNFPQEIARYEHDGPCIYPICNECQKKTSA